VVVVVVVAGETGSATVVVVRRTVVVVVVGGGVVTTSSLEQAAKVPPTANSRMRRSCVCITSNFRVSGSRRIFIWCENVANALRTEPDEILRQLPECGD
jgi:hypothetical protein